MARTAIEARLERFVREHRVTIAVVFPAIGAVTLVASATGLLPGWLSFNASLLLFGTLVMRLPLVGTLAPLFDRRTAAWFGVLVSYAYLIEYVGVRTGWPYGEFAYTVALGPMVGGVPLGLPVFFVPLVVNAYLLALLLTQGRRGTLPLEWWKNGRTRLPSRRHGPPSLLASSLPRWRVRRRALVAGGQPHQARARDPADGLQSHRAGAGFPQAVLEYPKGEWRAGVSCRWPAPQKWGADTI